jgi:hypothetical protein
MLAFYPMLAARFGHDTRPGEMAGGEEGLMRNYIRSQIKTDHTRVKTTKTFKDLDYPFYCLKISKSLYCKT